MAFTDRDAALATSCPACGSEPGEPCFSKDRTKVAKIENVHDERIAQYRDFVWQGVNAYDVAGLKP